jgi:hypothetical protein
LILTSSAWVKLIAVLFSSYSTSVSFRCCDKRFISLAWRRPRSQAVSGLGGKGVAVGRASAAGDAVEPAVAGLLKNKVNSLLFLQAEIF